MKILVTEANGQLGNEMRMMTKGSSDEYIFTDVTTVKIAELAGNTACDIQPCHSNEFPSPVKRPVYSVLDKTKEKDTFPISIPYWAMSIKECIQNLI